MHWSIQQFLPWSMRYLLQGDGQEGIMAKPIEIGLELHGQDARRFYKYMEDPTITDEGRALIREALRRASKEPL